jgi:Fuc2NAc and GlcNAc transferase
MLGKVILLGLVLGGSIVLAGCMRRYAINHHLIDQPNHRSSHTVPTPRGGGLAIVIPFLLAVAYLGVSNSLDWEFAIALLGGGVVVAAIGYLDDLNDLAPPVRLAGHFVAATWAVFWIGGMASVDLGFATVRWGVIGHILSVVGIVWMLNLYNFMDGIDGIASSETVIVAGFAGLLLFSAGADGLAWSVWILAAACLGFLFWNWPPAKIFLGDVGSSFLGFILASLAIASAKETDVSLWSWLILLGVFIVDATVTLVRRMFNGQKWYQAHCSHAYQHAASILSSHLKVTIGVVLVNVLWMLPLAWLANARAEYAIPVTAFALLPLLWLSFKLGAGLSDRPSSDERPRASSLLSIFGDSSTRRFLTGRELSSGRSSDHPSHDPLPLTPAHSHPNPPTHSQHGAES